MSKFDKRNIVLLFLLFLTLALMAMPYSVPEKAMNWTEDEITVVVVKTYAYFNQHFLSYGSCVPFISAVACVVAVFLLFILLSKKRKNKINVCFLLAIFISLIASAATFFIYKTLLSGIITGALFVVCVLFILYQKPCFKTRKV